MLRFRSYIRLLYEDRLDYIKRTMPQINSSHDTHAEHRDSAAIIDHFATKADPSKNKQYTQWILNRYNKGQIRQEDHPRIKETLENFELHKSKLANKDINHSDYNTLPKLKAALEPHIGSEPEVSDTAKEKELKAKGATLIHSENGTTVHKLNDMNGAMIYGRGTEWCTSASKATLKSDVHNPVVNYQNGVPIPGQIPDKPKPPKVNILQAHYEDKNNKEPSHYTIKKENGEIQKVSSDKVKHINMFHDYHEDGHMYVIHTPDGEKYQYHPASSQLMDKNDEPIETNEFVKSHPELKNVKEFKNSDEGYHFANNEKEFDAGIKRALNSEKNEGDLDEDEMLPAEAALNHPNITSKHLDIAAKHENPAVRAMAMGHFNISKKQIDKVAGNPNEDITVRRTALSNPKVDPKHLVTALNDENVYIRNAALSNPNIPEKYINDAIDKFDDSGDNLTQNAIVKNSNLSSNTIHKLIDHSKFHDMHALGDQSNLNADHINKILDKKEIPGKYALGIYHFNWMINHPSANKEVINKILNRPNLSDNNKKAAEKRLAKL